MPPIEDATETGLADYHLYRQQLARISLQPAGKAMAARQMELASRAPAPNDAAPITGDCIIVIRGPTSDEFDPRSVTYGY